MAQGPAQSAAAANWAGPGAAQIEYVKNVLELALLLLGLPWILRRIFNDPLKAGHDAAEARFG